MAETYVITTKVQLGARCSYVNTDNLESCNCSYMENASGEILTKGMLVKSSGTDRKFAKCAINDLDCIGIVLKDVAIGANCWIATNGNVQVSYCQDAMLGQFARVCVTADTTEVAGHAVTEAVPSTPFATDNHFREVGHCLETSGVPGPGEFALALTAIHFN